MIAFLFNSKVNVLKILEKEETSVCMPFKVISKFQQWLVQNNYCHWSALNR